MRIVQGLTLAVMFLSVLGCSVSDPESASDEAAVDEPRNTVLDDDASQRSYEASDTEIQINENDVLNSSKAPEESAVSPIGGFPFLDEVVTPALQARIDNPDEDSLDVYLRLMRNSNPLVRLQAIEAIEDFSPSDELTSALLARASDPDADVRESVTKCIQYMNLRTPNALKALGRLMTDTNESVQDEALYTVEEFGSDAQSLAPTLMQMISEGNDSLAQRAVDVLNRVGPPPESAPVLKSALDKVGREALYTMAKIEPPPTDMIPWLRGIMHSDDPMHIRMAAAWVLGNCGDSEPLLKAVTSEDEEVRAIGVEGLGGLKKASPKEIDALAASLKDENDLVRETASEAVGFLKSPPDRLLVELFRSFSDSHLGMRNQSRESVDKLIEEQLSRQKLIEVVNAAITKTPMDDGLMLAKSYLVYEMAYDALSDDQDPETALLLFDDAAKGLLEVVLKSDYKPASFEKDQISSLFYDAACAACLANKSDVSLKYLKAALENGWKDLEHLRADSDLDPLRQLPEYKEILMNCDDN